MTALARLFPPNGATQITRERQFLRDVQRLELAAALNEGDVEGAVVGSRRLLSVGCLLGEAAREVERG